MPSTLAVYISSRPLDDRPCHTWRGEVEEEVDALQGPASSSAGAGRPGYGRGGQAVAGPPARGEGPARHGSDLADIRVVEQRFNSTLPMCPVGPVRPTTRPLLEPATPLMGPLTGRSEARSAGGQRAGRQTTWLGSLGSSICSRASTLSRSASTMPSLATSANASSARSTCSSVWVAITEVRSIGRCTAGGNEQFVYTPRSSNARQSNPVPTRSSMWTGTMELSEWPPTL